MRTRSEEKMAFTTLPVEIFIHEIAPYLPLESLVGSSLLLQEAKKRAQSREVLELGMRIHSKELLDLFLQHNRVYPEIPRLAFTRRSVLLLERFVCLTGDLATPVQLNESFSWLQEKERLTLAEALVHSPTLFDLYWEFLDSSLSLPGEEWEVFLSLYDLVVDAFLFHSPELAVTLLELRRSRGELPVEVLERVLSHQLGTRVRISREKTLPADGEITTKLARELFGVSSRRARILRVKVEKNREIIRRVLVLAA